MLAQTEEETVPFLTLCVGFTCVCVELDACFITVYVTHPTSILEDHLVQEYHKHMCIHPIIHTHVQVAQVHTLHLIFHDDFCSDICKMVSFLSGNFGT
jgi:hypothetical protein